VPPLVFASYEAKHGTKLASISTTLDRYGHLLPEVHSEAAERLDATLFSQDSGTISKDNISKTIAESNFESTNAAK